MLIPCYVSGKGMHATHRTRRFKTEVIHILESTGLGYDTRYRYYQRQFPEKEPGELAQMVCDPIEIYDKDWEDYLITHGGGRDEDEQGRYRDGEPDGEAHRGSSFGVRPRMGENRPRVK